MTSCKRCGDPVDEVGRRTCAPCRDRRHRVAYIIAKGAIPDGLVIDHLCRVRHCVNPDHLEAVTALVNNQRGWAAKTHCKHGHEFTPENTLYDAPRGDRRKRQRRCRTCTRLRWSKEAS